MVTKDDSHNAIGSSSVVKEIKMLLFFQVSAFSVSLYLLVFLFFKAGENIVITSLSPAIRV